MWGATAPSDRAWSPFGALRTGGNLPTEYIALLLTVDWFVDRARTRAAPGPRIIYQYRRIYVKRVLTHKQYDARKWEAQLCGEHRS